MVEEASLKFRLRKIDETKNNLLDKIKRKDLMSEKFKEICKYLNYVEHLHILVSTFTGFVSIASLFCVPVGFTISTIGIKIFAIAAGIKKYKSITKKNLKKHDKIVLLGKDNLIRKG